MQQARSQDTPSGRVTHASLSMSGDDLDPAIVTSLLGIQPHRKFQKGDEYQGCTIDGIPVVRFRPSGVWTIESTRLVVSPDPSDHVSAVVELVHPVVGRWVDLQKKGYLAGLWIVHARTLGELGYTLDHCVLQKIADLRVYVSVVCNIIDLPPETP